MTRLTALAGLVLAGSLALLCAREAAAVLPPRYDETISILAQGPVRTLDPISVQTPAERDLAMALFEGLVRGNKAPAIARSWSVSPDRKTWTFHLRRGMRFSDGTPFGAAAVVSSWARLGNSPESAHLLDGIKAVAVDDTTLRLDLAKPSDDLLDRLSLPAAAVVRTNGPDNLVGSGPFRLVALKDGAFTLAPRLDHHDGRAYPGKLIVHSALQPPALDAADPYLLLDFGKIADAAVSASARGPWDERRVTMKSPLMTTDRVLRYRKGLSGLVVDPVSGVVRFETLWVSPAAGS